MSMSLQLALWCLTAGAVWLIASTLALNLLGDRLKVARAIPSELKEPANWGWHVLNFVMEFLFFVAIPTAGFSLFGLFLPFAGIRAGVAVALVAFALGAMPAIVGLSVRLNLAMPYLLFWLFTLLVKLMGALILIGWLHSL